jgi:hypothetical protein
VVPAFFRHFPGHLAADRGDFPLQVPHPRLPGVEADDGEDGVFRKLDVLQGQAVGLGLFGSKEMLGDLELFHFGIARQPDDLHAVLQGQGDGVEVIGRGDEHDFGEIVVAVQIVVVEGHVLLGVQDLKQGRGGIAPEVGAHLVHFVQAEDRVVALGLAQGLDDFSRQAPM